MRRPMCWLSVLFLLSVAAFLQIFSVIPQNYDRLPLLQDQTNVTVTGRVDNMTVREDRIVLTLKEVRVPEAYAKPTLNGKYGLLLYFPCDQTASLPQIGSHLQRDLLQISGGRERRAVSYQKIQYLQAD